MSAPAVGIIFIILIRLFLGKKSQGPQLDDRLAVILGFALFSLLAIGIGIVLPIWATIEDKASFDRVVLISFLACGGFASPFGYVAYRLWKKLPPFKEQRALAIKPASSRSSDWHWYILGIEPTHDIQAIKKAYRQRIKQCHPDIAGPKHHQQTVDLNEAYKLAIKNI